MSPGDSGFHRLITHYKKLPFLKLLLINIVMFRFLITFLRMEKKVMTFLVDMA